MCLFICFIYLFVYLLVYMCSLSLSHVLLVFSVRIYSVIHSSILLFIY